MHMMGVRKMKAMNDKRRAKETEALSLVGSPVLAPPVSGRFAVRQEILRR